MKIPTHAAIGGTALLTLTVLVATPPARAQAPLGSADSNSAITLDRAGSFITLDLTKKDDKNEPILRLGFQSDDKSATIRKKRLTNQDANVRGVLTWSVDLRATPDDGRGALFSGGSTAVGGQFNLSAGQAYLKSYIPARNITVYETNRTNLLTQRDGIVQAKNDLALAEANNDENGIRTQQRLLAQLRRGVVGIVDGLRTLRDNSNNARTRANFQILIDYGQSVFDFANSDSSLPNQPGMEPPNIPGVEPSESTILYDAWYLRSNYRKRSVTFYDPTKDFDEQLNDQEHDTWSVELGYNANYSRFLFFPFPIAFGASFGFGKSDNLDMLPSAEVTDTTTNTSTSADGTIKRVNTSVRKRNALRGTYEKAEVGLMNIDLVFYPDLANASRDGKTPRSSVAVDLFGRFKGGTSAVYGVGMYLTEPGAPTRVYGGLNVYRSAQKKTAIDIVVGYPF